MPPLAPQLQALYDEYQRTLNVVRSNPSQSDAARTHLATLIATDAQGYVWAMNDDAVWFRAQPGNQYEQADPQLFATSTPPPSTTPPPFSFGSPAAGPVSPSPFAFSSPNPGTTSPAVATADAWPLTPPASTAPTLTYGATPASTQRTKKSTTRTVAAMLALRVVRFIIAVIIVAAVVYLKTSNGATFSSPTTPTTSAFCGNVASNSLLVAEYTAGIGGLVLYTTNGVANPGTDSQLQLQISNVNSAQSSLKQLIAGAPSQVVADANAIFPYLEQLGATYTELLALVREHSPKFAATFKADNAAFPASTVNRDLNTLQAALVSACPSVSFQ